jgi:hypothetical protein
MEPVSSEAAPLLSCSWSDRAQVESSACLISSSTASPVAVVGRAVAVVDLPLVSPTSHVPGVLQVAAGMGSEWVGAAELDCEFRGATFLWLYLWPTEKPQANRMNMLQSTNLKQGFIRRLGEYDDTVSIPTGSHNRRSNHDHSVRMQRLDCRQELQCTDPCETPV